MTDTTLEAENKALREEVARLKDEADAVLFHQLCCLGGCHESLRSLAKLAKSVGFVADPATNQEIDAVLADKGEFPKSHDCYAWDKEDRTEALAAAEARAAALEEENKKLYDAVKWARRIIEIQDPEFFARASEALEAINAALTARDAAES